MNLLIPKRFDLAGYTWKVEIIDDLRMAHELCNFRYRTWDNAPKGLCDPEGIIYLNRDAHDNDASLVHTFWHEVGHAMLFVMGYYEAKYHKEQSIDAWGALMAQLWITAKGDQHL